MVFIACGLNHKTAPLLVRETIALPAARHDELLHHLVGLPAINEAAILSTCNRTEIYCDTDDPTVEPGMLVARLSNNHPLASKALSPYCYSHHGHDGIRHTLRVASGLDSMMLGEPQIFGQMKQAYRKARKAGTAKTNLQQVFDYVFGASKRIRCRSGIGINPISIAYAAVQLIGQLFTNPASLRVFLIGSGETVTLVAKYLHKQGVTNFFFANRTEDNAQKLAMAFGGEALTINDIPYYLCKADVIVSATACPLPFITKNLVEHALIQRKNEPMFFLDLAVPRDIEMSVASLKNVYLYNIDDLQTITDEGMNERRFAAIQAEQLVDCELDNYIRWHRSLHAKHIICDYRHHMKVLAQQELQRAKLKLSSGLNQEAVLHEFCERLVNKLTHHPTKGLRKAACDGREELLDLINYLFNLSHG